jgi:hypothetical protein
MNGCRADAYFAQGLKECVGLTELAVQVSWRLYPNPTSGSFRIELSDMVNVGRMEITNITGALVYSKEVQGTVLEADLKGMGKGIYLVKVYSAGRLILLDKVIATE